MKKLILFVVITLAGCVGRFPAASFTPYTSSDGVQGWRVTMVNYLEKSDPTPLIEYEVGNRQMCQKGWEVIKQNDFSTPSDRIIVYEGRCK